MNSGAKPKRRALLKAATTNAVIAELFARKAEESTPPLDRAFRRASRRAFLWPEEASALYGDGRCLAELQSFGPYIEKIIVTWLDDPPPPLDPPALRSGFLTWTQARSILSENPDWLPSVKGDLQMHSLWSDGDSSVADMAQAALERDYEYIAMTDHAKRLKIAGGIDEAQLSEQAAEIDAANRTLEADRKLRVLRSIELRKEVESPA